MGKILRTAAVVLSLLAPAAVIAPEAATAAPVTVLTSDFEDGTAQGWFARGPSTVAPSTVVAHGGTTSLLSSSRAATWQGPGRNLLGVLQKGATYAIDAHVRMAAGEVAAAIHLTVQRTPDGGSTVFERVATATTADSGWVLLRGEYSFQVDNTELQLYLESASATASFHVDDIVVTQISPPPGGPPDEAGIVSDFETGTGQGWGPRIGSEQLTVTDADAHSGQFSLLTTGRQQVFAGPAINVFGRMGKGKTYNISIWMKLAPGEPATPLRLSLERRLAGTPTFETLVGNTTVTPQGWVRFTNQYTLAVDVDFLSIYAESASGTPSFYIDDFAMTFLPPLPIERDTPSLKDVLDFPIGTAIDATETVGVHSELLLKHFSQVTPGNALKWDATEPTEGQFRWTDADPLVAFATANGLRVRGHTLVWHSQTPAWVFQRPDGIPLTSSPEDKALLLRRLEHHIRTVAGRYQSQIYAWDVVNEVLDEYQPDGMRRSPWYQITGLDFIRTAFRVARETAPQARLYINDYNTHSPRKREFLFGLVRQLRAEGVPIDGVGHQMHIAVQRPPIAEIEQAITRFVPLGVDQEVTELDMSVYTNFTESFAAVPPEVIALQGYRYRDVFDVFRRQRAHLRSVTVWGQGDDNTWLKNFPFPRLDLPLLFDERLQAKPAYWGVVDPTRLPPLTRTLRVPAGDVQVDGERELQWDLLPATAVNSRSGLAAGFQVRWDAGHLYVLAEVADPTRDVDDIVEIFVDENNAKTPAYQADDARYRVHRNGLHWPGSGARARGREIPGGYRVEVSVPLRTAPGTAGRAVGLDLRIRDSSRPGEPLSWNDHLSTQDTNPSRWGTLTLVEEIRRAEARKGTPAVDGLVDEVWSRAPEIVTTVPVVGTPGATATARLLWDDRHLYVLAQVTDQVLDESSPNAHEEDSVEVFVDSDNGKTAGYDDDDGQYRVSFTNRQTLGGNFDAFAIVGNLASAAVVTPGGYLVEYAIELDTVTLGDGMLLGFDLQVNDATGGVRAAATTWHDPSGRSFLSTSGWGVARLRG